VGLWNVSQSQEDDHPNTRPRSAQQRTQEPTNTLSILKGDVNTGYRRLAEASGLSAAAADSFDRGAAVFDDLDDYLGNRGAASGTLSSTPPWTTSRTTIQRSQVLTIGRLATKQGPQE
jgi:hypothetical protein